MRTHESSKAERAPHQIPALTETDPRIVRMGDAVAFVTYPTAGAVFTREGAVLIDGPMAPATALQWKAFVEAHGPIRYHILCEHHEDHSASCAVMGSNVVISTEVTADQLGVTAARSNEEMRQTLRGWGRNRFFAEELVESYTFRSPDMTYAKRVSFMLGGKRFIVFEAPGHTRGSSIVHAVDDRVAFVADNVFPGSCAPPAQSADPWAWMQTLGLLEALDVDWYVPGHGDPFGREGIHRQRIGLLTLIDAVRGWKREGWSRERVVREGRCFDRSLRPPQRGDADVPPGLHRLRPMIEALSLGCIYDYLDEHPSGAIRPHVDAYIDVKGAFEQ